MPPETRHSPAPRGRSHDPLVALLLVTAISGALLACAGATPSPGAGLPSSTGAGMPSSTGWTPTSVPAPTTFAAEPAPRERQAPSPSSAGIEAGPTAGAASVPIVPVVDFRSTATAAGWRDVAEIVGGTSTRWRALELVRDEAEAVLVALHVRAPVPADRLALAATASALMADLAVHRDRLAFLPAGEVGPGVRAIRWGKQSLFGEARVQTLDAWTLNARFGAVDGAPADGATNGGTAADDGALPGNGADGGTAGGTTAATSGFDPSAVWTMFVGGDLGLDRQVAQVVTYEHKGVDYPFDGGTARITGSVCCSAFGWPVPTISQTGGTSAMRTLIDAADLALANLEEPAPDHFTFHPSGTVFTGNPALLAGIARAGIDVVSMANNHVGDGGPAGILQTIAHLDENGIAHFGAGANLAQARRPALVTVDGVKVAILGYDSIASAYYGATASRPGSAPLTEANVRADVAAARKAGAQMVIVFPHWGVEYTRGPSAYQQRLAHVAIDAGADMVIGNHPHWVQAMEVYKGHPIWYALGNFTFDQTWSEPTLEGITLELTFEGNRLVQAWMHPHVLVDGVQPNLLDPARDGARVLDPLYEASSHLAW